MQAGPTQLNWLCWEIHSQLHEKQLTPAGLKDCTLSVPG